MKTYSTKLSRLHAETEAARRHGKGAARYDDFMAGWRSSVASHKEPLTPFGCGRRKWGRRD